MVEITFWPKIKILDLGGARHQLCIYIVLSTPPCNQMAVLGELPE